MLRIIKMLKPNTLLLIITIILVSITGIASLMLPDRMSVIIGEGITSEMVYEETADGELIYLNIPTQEPIPLPKFAYEDAGELVLTKTSGKYFASIVLNFLEEPYYEVERDLDGNIIYLPMPNESGEISYFPMPVILRTVDGDALSERQQGRMLLDDSGAPQILRKQVSHLDVIWRNGTIMIIITFISSVASIIVAFLSSKIGMDLGKRIRSMLFKKSVYFSQEEEDQFGTASLITRMTNDVTHVQMIVIMAIRMMLVVPVVFIGGLIMALSKDAKMTLVLLVSAPLVMITIFIVASKIVPMFKKMQKRVDNLTLVARENITGVRVIRAFNQDERENKRFDYANRQVTGLALRAARTMAILFPVMQFFMSMMSISVMIIAIGIVNRGLQIGTLDFSVLGNMMAVVQYMMQIMFSIIMFSIVFIMVPRASVSAERINEVLSTENKIVDPINPDNNLRRGGDIEYNNVSFRFPKASNNVLNEINFSVRSGETVAIIGSTGAGKSTLINLIPRLYDVTEGEIIIDGLNVKDYTQEELRSRIGFVTQKAMLFEGTIRENISYGKPDATEEEIVRAARIAQAEEFIDNYEDKYEHRIEQGGANLSGGQKQRLAIARAVCRKPSIYIFDDSFSALDFATEKKLRKALSKEIKNSTVLIVAQRIGTIMNADRIIVLQEGRVVGIGKHRQLLKSCEVYREIAVSQLSEEELLRDNAAFEGGAL